jgi:hypothetical protein
MLLFIFHVKEQNEFSRLCFELSSLCQPLFGSSNYHFFPLPLPSTAGGGAHGWCKYATRSATLCRLLHNHLSNVNCRRLYGRVVFHKSALDLHNI